MHFPLVRVRLFRTMKMATGCLSVLPDAAAAATSRRLATTRHAAAGMYPCHGRNHTKNYGSRNFSRAARQR